MLINILFLTIAIFYTVLIITFWIGWQNTLAFSPESKSSPEEHGILLSVIIPFRNEKNNLEALIDSLAQQDYPEELHEFIFIDDHSEDNSIQLLKKLTEKINNIKILQNGKKETGKKSALLKGISHAQGKIIVQTDADCTMGNNWLSTIAAFYNKHNPSMLLSPVVLTGQKNILQTFQEFENAALITTTCGSTYFKKPILANGANMSYKKEIIEKNKDPFKTSIPSGDDIFLLQTLINKHEGEVKFLKAKDAAVYTEACNNFNEIKNQKKRWLQKSKHYKNKNITINGMIAFSGNLVVILSLIMSIATSGWWIFSLVFSLKIFADSLAILSPMIFFKRRLSLHSLFISHLIYPVYTIWLVVIAFKGNNEWKNRKIVER
ncbi:MAG: glycosyltransferase [Bacteroidales bacterium]